MTQRCMVCNLQNIPDRNSLVQHLWEHKKHSLISALVVGECGCPPTILKTPPSKTKTNTSTVQALKSNSKVTNFSPPEERKCREKCKIPKPKLKTSSLSDISNLTQSKNRGQVSTYLKVDPKPEILEKQEIPSCLKTSSKSPNEKFGSKSVREMKVDHNILNLIPKNSAENKTKNSAIEKQHDKNSAENKTKNSAIEKQHDKNSAENKTKNSAIEKQHGKNSAENKTKNSAIEKQHGKNSAENKTKNSAIEKQHDKNSAENKTKNSAIEKQHGKNSAENKTKNSAIEKQHGKNSAENKTKNSAIEKQHGIIEPFDFATTFAKNVRQELEKQLDCNLQSRKKEIDETVMKFVSGKDKKKAVKKGSDEEEEEEGEESGDEKKPAKRANSGKKPAGGRCPKGVGKDCTKPLKLSPELAALVGQKSMTCVGVVRKVWSIIKERDLYDPKNKQYVICDDDLLKVIGEKRFRRFEMIKYLKNHFIR